MISDTRRNEIEKELRKIQPNYSSIRGISIESSNETTTTYKVKYLQMILGHRDVDDEYITLPNEPISEVDR
jgi:hypothetical protein